MTDFSYTLHIRKNFINLIDNLSLTALNKTPKGFQNNIIWNFGHIVVTQQILCYKLSNITLKTAPTLIELFSKGSSPKISYDKSMVENLKRWSIDLLKNTKKDYEKNLFKTFTTYQTSFGITLNNIEDSIAFNNIHEGLHLGYAMAMRKALNLS